MQLILNTYGLQIDRKEACFFVSSKEHQRKISTKRVSSILITHACNISSEAILLAVEFEIPILLVDRLGKVKARLWSPDFKSLAKIRRNQLVFSESLEVRPLVLSWFKDKLTGQQNNLLRLCKRVKKHRVALESTAQEIEDILKNNQSKILESKVWKPLLLNTESQIAKKYWQVLGLAMEKYLPFEKRSRRPAQDAFNASVNYLYGMLYNQVEICLLSAGLDVEIGFLHVEEYNQPVLAYDLIEPFRPWTDAIVLDLAIKRKLKPNCFEPKDGGIYLNKEGKKVIIPAYFEEMNKATFFNQKRIKRKDQIHYYAVKLAQKMKNFQR